MCVAWVSARCLLHEGKRLLPGSRPIPILSCSKCECVCVCVCVCARVCLRRGVYERAKHTYNQLPADFMRCAMHRKRSLECAQAPTHQRLRIHSTSNTQAHKHTRHTHHRCPQRAGWPCACSLDDRPAVSVVGGCACGGCGWVWGWFRGIIFCNHR